MENEGEPEDEGNHPLPFNPRPSPRPLPSCGEEVGPKQLGTPPVHHRISAPCFRSPPPHVLFPLPSFSLLSSPPRSRPVLVLLRPVLPSPNSAPKPLPTTHRLLLDGLDKLRHHLGAQTQRLQILENIRKLVGHQHQVHVLQTKQSTDERGEPRASRRAGGGGGRGASPSPDRASPRGARTAATLRERRHARATRKTAAPLEAGTGTGRCPCPHRCAAAHGPRAWGRRPTGPRCGCARHRQTAARPRLRESGRDAFRSAPLRPDRPGAAPPDAHRAASHASLARRPGGPGGTAPGRGAAHLPPRGAPRARGAPLPALVTIPAAITTMVPPLERPRAKAQRARASRRPGGTRPRRPRLATTAGGKRARVEPRAGGRSPGRRARGGGGTGRAPAEDRKRRGAGRRPETAPRAEEGGGRRRGRRRDAPRAVQVAIDGRQFAKRGPVGALGRRQGTRGDGAKERRGVRGGRRGGLAEDAAGPGGADGAAAPGARSRARPFGVGRSGAARSPLVASRPLRPHEFVPLAPRPSPSLFVRRRSRVQERVPGSSPALGGDARMALADQKRRRWETARAGRGWLS